jgi:hypothetical protein
MVTRNQIVEAARSFVGLPYNEKLPSKGLLLAVGERLGLHPVIMTSNHRMREHHTEGSASRGSVAHVQPGGVK